MLESQHAAAEPPQPSRAAVVTEMPVALIVTACVYPLLATLVYAVGWIVVRVIEAQNELWSLAGMVELLAEGVAALAMAVAVAAIAILPTLPVMWILGSFSWVACRGFTRLAKFEVPPAQFEGYVVGLAGFATVGLVSFFWWAELSPIAPFVVWLLLGPGLVTPVGQWVGVALNWPADGSLPEYNPPQFSLRRVFVFTSVVAVALAVLKFANALHPTLLAVVGGWLLYQLVTMHLVMKWLRWRHLHNPALAADGPPQGGP